MDSYRLLSHPAEKNVKEKKLTDHLLNVAQHIQKDLEAKSLNLNLIRQVDLVRLGFVIGLLHDLGKATLFFQKHLRKQHVSPKRLTHHSLFSAVACCHMVQHEFTGGLGQLWAYVAFHVVYRHHGNLIAFDMMEASSLDLSFFETQRKSLFDNYSKPLIDFYAGHGIDLAKINEVNPEVFKDNIQYAYDEWLEEADLNDEDRIEFFFVVNLLFSLLIDFDKGDAARLEYDYFEGNLEDPIVKMDDFLSHCRRDTPDKFDETIPINRIRNDFLNEIQANKNISKDRFFYSITAPTGIGKTFGCLAFAEKLKQKLAGGKGKIVYCLPYTSIIDQNYLEFENIIKFCTTDYQERPHRYLLKHHCLTQNKIDGRTLKENYEYKDYLDDRLFTESWQSAIIVTTFVQFFHSLIGHKNRFLKKFHNIVNSIIILDEIQNINPDYYSLLKQCFTILGERFNTYFVLVTATQPEILDNEQIISVVDHKKYMTADLFNRVRLTYHHDISSIEEFSDHFISNFRKTNCLVVMNTIKAAQKLYEEFKTPFKNYELYCLTTCLTPFDRKNQIEEIKNHLNDDSKKIIVIATQLIEAGVDFSFQTVYRDFGPMDSIVQVAGRCNRHGEYGILGGEMTLLNLDNSRIYKHSLIQYAKTVVKHLTYESRDFLGLSESYFSQFSYKSISNQLLKSIKACNYDKKNEGEIPISDFKLIEENPTSERLFILNTPEAQADMENLINSLKILQEKELPSEGKNPLLYKIELLKHKLNPFAISVYKKDLVTFHTIVEPDDVDLISTFYPYKYISYERQAKYAYDPTLGFCSEPRKPLPASSTF